MINGVNFQPGGTSQATTKPKPDSTQEAIKILSLRLPKVVGAKALAPAALLNAQGSGGNPRVDSVVNQVMSRYLPGGEGAGMTPPAAPMVPNAAPEGSPFAGHYPPTMPLSNLMPSQASPGATTPRITPGDDRDRPSVSLPRPPVPDGEQQGKTEITPESVAPPAPTQDPWADLAEYLRRREPAPPQETPSI